ncbi:hypothetical protein ACNF42_08465 [Cuniculiplasma sp. SKW3]|uniref:hypothetical protein n=1 Tax=unclassified Cuniculiplasma TaxID=2619706 RepID=UPI003FD4D6C6
MKILIVIDVLNGHNGTFKIMRNIAYGFADINDVKIIFFGKSKDYKNVLPLLEGFNYTMLSNKFLYKFESIIKNIIIKNHENIKLDDVPLFSIQFSLFKYLRKIDFEPDFIIFSNYFSSLSLLINNKINSIVLLHEAPLFNDFNFLIRKFIYIYLSIISKKTKFLSISQDISKKTMDNFKFKVITRPPIGFIDYNVKDKERFILLDTRWTEDRDPLFVVNIAKNMRNIKIIMHGIFTNDNIKEQLIKKITFENYNVQLISNDSDDELQNLYQKALVVIRWAGFNERGNPLSIFNAISYNCIPVVDKALGLAPFISENISPDLVVNKDKNEIAIVVKKIFEDRSYYDNLLCKVIECKERFSWKKYSEQLINEIIDSR